jgi:tripeptide aminopeptidase
MMKGTEMRVHERFIDYVKYDTTSDPFSKTCPSTDSQMIFAEYLVEQMKEIGINNAYVDEHGYVYGFIDAKPGCENVEAVGFIAHMDTSDAVSGKNIKPRIISSYDGKDIVLNNELAIVMEVEKYPHLKNYAGHDLIVTDGTTLLGVDDKAGIAEILNMAEALINNESIKHGRICIAFTPDEEIGRGADLFDVKKFHASYAYTVDGGPLGDIQYENFNAASADITVTGLSVHPGGAKNVMKNAILIGYEFNSMLPCNETPQYTEKKEGFHHLHHISGTEEKLQMKYILRDHDYSKLSKKKEHFKTVSEFINNVYGKDTIVMDIKDTYLNMAEMLKPHMHIIERANRAYAALGYTPTSHAIRGGTDGARLSYMGLLCPNIATGGHNAHGRFEYVSINEMEKMVEVLVHMACDINQ